MRMLLLAAAGLGPCGGCGPAAESSGTLVRVSDWGSPAVVSDFMRKERQFREEFEALHPGVRVRKEQIPGYGQYAPKLLMSHVSGSVPDVCHLDASSGAVFINNGVVRDLAPLVRSDPSFRLDDYFETVAATFRRGEQLYAIPLDFTPMVMYYNKALFDRAGVPYPQDGWTWEQFLDTARRLTILPDDPKRPPLQYGMHFENVMPFWVLWLWNNGGDVLSPDGRRASGYLDGERSVAAIRFLIDLMFTHRVAPSLQESAAAGVDLFRSRRAAMDVKGHWMMIDYRDEGIDFGVVSLPTNVGRPVTVSYQSGIAIMSRARQPALAWEYIKFMTSEAVQVRRVDSGLAISGNRRAAARYADSPIEQAFLRQLSYARPPWGAWVERYPFIEELGQEMLRDIVYSVPGLRSADGSIDPAALQAMIEQMAHQTATLIDAALAE